MREYLGDSVYADYDGHYIVLTIDNGEGTTKAIYMEPQVCDAFERFQKKVHEMQRKFLTGVTNASVVEEKERKNHHSDHTGNS